MFVKICGVTTEEDALLSVALGADALGFNFVAGSQRLVSVHRVADIVKRVPNDIVTVGVFRSELPARIVEIVHEIGLTGAQVHGMRREDVEQIARQVRFCVRVFTAGDDTIRNEAPHPCHALMLDAPNPGGGELFDWSLVGSVPHRRWLLAGGLGPNNVAAAIEALHPWGVDVATGTEAEPGRKDPRKLRAFIHSSKAAGERVAPMPAAAGDDPLAYDPLAYDLASGSGVHHDVAGNRPFDWEEDL